MQKIHKRFQIVLSILIISTITCRFMPGSTSSPEEETSDPVEAAENIVAIKDETFTENVDTYAADLATHQETGELLAILQTNGFTTYIEGGDYEYSDGSKLHAINLTDGSSAVFLTQMEKPSGAIDAAVYEFIDERTIFIWDQSGGIEISISEDGQMDYLLLDAAGNPLSELTPQPMPHFKSASILPQSTLGCTNGMSTEFDACVKNLPNGLQLSAACGALFTASMANCFVPPFIDCVGWFAFAGISCAVAFKDCLWEMTDDPPTPEYSKAEETESYSYCLDNGLVTEKLFQVQTTCKDDRLPAPKSPSQIFLTSGESKEFSCTDCGGQTITEIIPPPEQITTIECEFGCQPLGDGNARCLKEGETLTEEIVTNIPVGTYEGITTLPAWIVSEGAEYEYGGSDELNKIVVNVAEDGTVSGNLEWHRIADGFSDEYCTYQYQMKVTGTLNGKLTDLTGQVTFVWVNDWSAKISGSEDCFDQQSTFENEGYFDITVKGNTMEGTYPEWFNFTATKITP